MRSPGISGGEVLVGIGGGEVLVGISGGEGQVGISGGEVLVGRSTGVVFGAVMEQPERRSRSTAGRILLFI
jgi:hypothetical protein